MNKTEIAKFPECQQTCARLWLKGSKDCINCDSFKVGRMKEIKLVRKPNWKIVLEALDNGIPMFIGNKECIFHENRLYYKVHKKYLVGAQLLEGFEGCIMPYDINLNDFIKYCEELSAPCIMSVVHQTTMRKLEKGEIIGKASTEGGRCD